MPRLIELFQSGLLALPVAARVAQWIALQFQSDHPIEFEAFDTDFRNVPRRQFPPTLVEFE